MRVVDGVVVGVLVLKGIRCDLYRSVIKCFAKIASNISFEVSALELMRVVGAGSKEGGTKFVFWVEDVRGFWFRYRLIIPTSISKKCRRSSLLKVGCCLMFLPQNKVCFFIISIYIFFLVLFYTECLGNPNLFLL